MFRISARKCFFAAANKMCCIAARKSSTEVGKPAAGRSLLRSCVDRDTKRTAVTLVSSTPNRRTPEQPERNGMRRMGARFLFIVPVSIGLFSGNECAHAQSAPSNVQGLPPIVVSPTAPKPKSGPARTAPRTIRPAPIVASRVAAKLAPSPALYPTTPVSSPGSGIDVEKVPASVNIVDGNQIGRTQSANIADALQKYVPSIVVNEVTGNPFQPNVQFRGFVASPVAGTPAGTCGLPEWGAHQRSVRRHGQLGPDPDRCDSVGSGGDQ
jgi:hypothetical protein